MTFKSKMLTILLPVALIASPPPALAWGNVGHAAVANLAEPNLQPAMWCEIQGLLALEGAAYLADVASWADTQRLPGSPLHSTRIPVNGDPAPAHVCPGSGMCADMA